MNVIICVDDKGGVLFNRRRQSTDRILRRRLLELCGDSVLWMTNYSARSFEEADRARLRVHDNCIAKAGPGEYCFVEGAGLLPYEDRIERLILVHWNRVYPADTYFDIPLKAHGWAAASREEFAGSSHEKLTLETYIR